MTKSEGVDQGHDRLVPPFAEEIALARALADLAAEISLGTRPDGLAVQEKPDGTPVTRVDREIERAVRAAVADRFPRDGFLGEEEGSTGGTERVWTVDPIDGTRNLVDGIQLWATLIALQVRGEAVLGVVDLPALGERYEGVRGAGAWLNGAPIRVSDTATLDRAFVLHSAAEEWLGSPGWDRFERVVRGSRRTRGISDAWGHMLVARGSADVLLEHEPCGVWDWVAARVVLEEAGGRMTTLGGGEPFDGCDLLSTNGLVHDEVLGVLDQRA